MEVFQVDREAAVGASRCASSVRDPRL